MSTVAVLSAPRAASSAERLFVGSCVALSGSAVMFAVLADIMNALKVQFVLTNVQIGWIVGGQMGFTVAIFALGPLCDALGMKPLLGFAFVCQTLGVALMIFATGFWSLLLGVWVNSIGSGTIEAVCNPLIATLYPDRKTQKLNQFHVWWPGGIVLGGLACFVMNWIGLNNWQLKLLLVLLPTIAYGVMLAGHSFPATERVQSGITFRQMVRETFMRPLFIILLICMTMTASLELGPQRWIPSVLEAGHVPGILVLAWITGLMAVMRFLNGPVVRRLGGMGVLLASSAVAGIGLTLLSFASGMFEIGVAATVFALGVCYFWPTMLGAVAERIPKGGALALAVMGGWGTLCVTIVTTPLMGAIADQYLHRELTTPTVIADKTVDRQARTVAALQQVNMAYSSWERTLGQSKHDQATRADIDASLAIVYRAMNLWKSTGTLPEGLTANALRSAINGGPGAAARSSPAEAKALAAEKQAEAILDPAENYGGLISFRYVAPASILLFVIFGVIFLRDRMLKRRLSRNLQPRA